MAVDRFGHCLEKCLNIFNANTWHCWDSKSGVTARITPRVDGVGLRKGVAEGRPPTNSPFLGGG